MSNVTPDNSQKPKPKGTLLRIETAGDIPEDKLERIAAKFAQHYEIPNYRLKIESKPSLVGGFIIYYHGDRYDYSVKGQLTRMNAFIKRTRADSFKVADSFDHKKDDKVSRGDDGEIPDSELFSGKEVRKEIEEDFLGIIDKRVKRLSLFSLRHQDRALIMPNSGSLMMSNSTDV